MKAESVSLVAPMRRPLLQSGWPATFGLILLVGGGSGFAGSGPYRVAVLVNDNSRESQELGQYYQEARGIPEAQVIHLSTTTNDIISLANFDAEIYGPLTNQLWERGLEAQIDTVVYTRGMPYQVFEGSSYNGITAATFYGFKTYPSLGTDGCTRPPETASPYFSEERAFADAAPPGAPFLSTLLTAWDLDQAKDLVDRSAIADGAAPASQVLYLHSTDPDRNVRWPQTEGADFTRRLFNTPQTGTFLTADSVTGETDVMGYMIGLPSVAGITGNTYLPGAIADHVTSYAGVLYTSSQMSLLDWINAGVSGSYGTVTEPCNYTQKFPHAMLHTWYARGFTLAESLAMSVENPYMGITVGDPLCTPYGIPPAVTVTGITDGAVLVGAVPFTVIADAASARRPVDRIDLYIDEGFAGTLTHVSFTAGDQVSVTVDSRTRSYTVSASDDVADVASGLAAAVNSGPGPTLSVSAQASGDRVELIQKAFGSEGGTIGYGSSISTGADATLWAPTAGATLLEPIYPARQEITLEGAPTAGDVVDLVVTRLDGVKATHSVVAAEGEDGLAVLNRLATEVNTDPLLTGVGGVSLQFLVQSRGEPWAQGFVEARDVGWETHDIQIAFSVTPTEGSLLTGPDYTGFLTSNEDVMSARGLVSIARGRAQLSAPTVLDTFLLDDGPHTLRAVALDGTAARVEGDTVVSFTVDNHDLDCALLTPGDLEAYLYGQDVRMVATVGGGAGIVTSVRFVVEGRVIADASAPPYEASFSTVDIGVGRVTLQALALTDAGESTLSEPVELLILNPDDADSDGLPDGWEVLHFTHTTYTTGAADSDQDGQDNQLEFAADSDPNDPDHFFSPTEIFLNGAQLVLRFPSRSTRRYGVQQNPDVLVNPAAWDPPTPDWSTGSPGETTWTGPSLSDLNFIRLAAEPPLLP